MEPLVEACSPVQLQRNPKFPNAWGTPSGLQKLDQALEVLL